MADSTAMTVDFLRARLLSERSVSRAAKERADELANRVAELEEQVREVTEQRRQAEHAAAEVFAILESQGFGAHLLADGDDDSGSSSDQDDGDEEKDAKSRAAGEEEETLGVQGEADDAQSGTAQPGGLSWKGRSVSPRKARQLKHKHRRSYFYLLSSSDSSSPKYRMGQSCRKNKRQTVTSNGGRSVSPGEDGGGDAVAAESQNERQDGSLDFTYDGHDDMDGEVGGDERSSGDGGGGQYVIRYEKDGEMERVLERQAELIGQYEEQEEAQREWEKQYNENRNANNNTVAAEAEHSNQGANQAARCGNNVLPKGSLTKSPQNISQEHEANDEPDQSVAQTTSVSARESSNTSTVTRQNQHPGDDSAIRTPSERRSPSSDTLDSKVSDWSSSHFHDVTADSQLDNTQSNNRPPSSSSSNLDVGSVLEALQRARISLNARLSKPVPPSQVMLALPAPGDDLIEHDDLPADDDSSSYREERGSSSPVRQEILALPAPGDYYRERLGSPVNDTGISVREKSSSSSSPRRQEMLALPAPGDNYRREIDEYMKLPVCAPGLFRLPTDSFPADQRMFSGNVRASSGFSLGAVADTNGSLSNPAATEAPSTSGDGSEFSAQQCYDIYSSMATAGRCNSIARPDFTMRETSFLSGVSGMGDTDLFMQRGIDYTISNKWMI